jgi:hypothetical protein
MKLEELIECMLITLNENFDENFEADIVLIENQPALLNGNMKTISVVIYTYFNMMRLANMEILNKYNLYLPQIN